MALKLKNLIVWLPRETIRAIMPKSFNENYPITTVIIDCAETFIQRAKNFKSKRRHTTTASPTTQESIWLVLHHLDRLCLYLKDLEEDLVIKQLLKTGILNSWG